MKAKTGPRDKIQGRQLNNWRPFCRTTP